MTHRLALAAALLVLPVPLAAQDTVQIVRSVRFEGNRAIDDYTLSIAIATTQSSWFARSGLVSWLGLGEKRTFDPREFRRDVWRLTLLYRQSGFMDVRVDTLVKRQGRDVRVTFTIQEGPPIVLTALTVTGVDTLRDAQEVLQDLPLKVGEPFNRFLFQASADSIVQRLRNRGYAGAAVFRNYAVDREHRTATAALDVVPGRRMTVGPIRVEGAERVDTSFVRQLLSTRSGDLYQENDLYQSQRKLYQTELFRFATVTIDSAAFDPDTSARVPLVVLVSEGRRYRIRSGVGFATNDCFRGSAGWTDRNLLGSGRLFDLTGRVSKLGVGSPFDWGLGRSICSSLENDTIGSSLVNYSVTAAVRQPRFFTPTITSTVSLFAERRSEFAVYRRDEVGGSFGLVRETERRIPVTLAYRLSYGETEASAATFCAFFNACTPQDAGRLRQRRLLGIVSLGAVWPRSNNPLDPSRGHLYSFDLSHSSRATGSARFQTFTRLTGDAAWYRTLAPGVVLSWHLRGGIIFSPPVSLDSGTTNFVPPEERFYAGGPNDVRGYNRNELGPVVYVLDRPALDSAVQDSLDRGLIRPRFSATGGNTLGIGQVELRVPSPIWSQRMRLAFFVDAGTLFTRGEESLAPVRVRLTPGVGVRFATPLGPARFDVGYNGYDQAPGALYLVSNGTLTLARTNFVQRRGSRFSFHFSFGQPF
ncbi:MAG TPA: BamA/TamA family outer membrane protein [Gemmatimonadales bacterium]|nr:BamA/TamA family outer membrane protein [Gemmatimonadales bacterium]